MKQFRQTFVVFALALVACVCCAACTDTADAKASTASSTESRPPSPSAALPPCAPLRIAVFGDRTASVETTATASISEEQLSRLIAILRRCGGELAYGDIKGRGESFKPLTRLRVDLPEAKPVRTTTLDPFEQAALDELYAKHLAAYRRSLDAAREKSNGAVDRFLVEVRPRLGQPSTAANTDVQSAVARARVFLDEPQSNWPSPPLRIAMLVSDMQHNTSKWTLDVSGDVTWLLVNGIGSRGSFPSSGATAFEGVDSALQFVEDAVTAPQP